MERNGDVKLKYTIINKRKIMNNKIEKEKNYIVKKNENLLLAKHNLNENSLKIMACIISQIKKDDDDFTKYKLTVKDYQILINSKNKNTLQEMIKASDQLLKTIIKINIENGKFLHTTFIRNFRYDKEEGSFILFKIDSDFKPFLLNLKKNFLSYNIFNILKLKSSYSIRLYELLKHHYNQNIKYSNNNFIILKISLNNFKEIFQIPNSYTIINIKKNILEKSKVQFLEKTDINFEYQLNKINGRSYDEIVFTIRKNMG